MGGGDQSAVTVHGQRGAESRLEAIDASIRRLDERETVRERETKGMQGGVEGNLGI